MEQIHYKDYIYSLSDEGHLSINIKSGPNLRTVLYKYYSDASHNIEALLSHYLYASHPIQFNDIMDCSMFMIDCRNLIKDNYNQFYEEYGNTLFRKIGYEKDKENNFNSFRFHIYMWYYSQFGIVSLTVSPLNTLMWAHYTHETGFVIQFNHKLMSSISTDNKDIVNTNLRMIPVQYCDNLEPIDFFSGEFKSPTVPMTCISTNKERKWCYENEWRIVVQKSNMGYTTGLSDPREIYMEGLQDRYLYYSPAAIEAICLGAYFFGSSHCELEGHNLKVKKDYIPLFNYLFENHNEHLFISIADYSEQNNVTRRNRKISLIRHRRNLFEVVDEERKE